jgi:hypothetical protein
VGVFNIRSWAPMPSMCLQEITVAPAFAANQRHRLLSGCLPLCVISRVPPRLCNVHLTWGAMLVLDLPSSSTLRAALAHELETSAIAQTTQISDRMSTRKCLSPTG